MRSLVHKMAPTNKITLPSHEASLDKEQAKSLYPRKARLRVKIDYIDGCYAIANIKCEQDSTVYFNLEIDGQQPIRASVDLNPEAADQLYNKTRGQNLHQDFFENILSKMET